MVYEGTNDTLPLLSQEYIGNIEVVKLSVGNNYVYTKINSVKQINTKLYSIDLGSYYGYDRDSVTNITATIDSSGQDYSVFYLKFTVPAHKYTPNAFLTTDSNGNVVTTTLNDADNTMYGG